uniref:Hemoglobinase n=1 Tax=Crassostrea virginica TaxID=6565 RepID=A0A8B8DPV0_CRAVI|nr:legumain-like isoform X2 [Crassostrea virginica]
MYVRGNKWVLLVAGSHFWKNYRHQADVCHAYQIVKNHGIPERRIVVMMADDIANNSLNPTKGKIINQPKGENVYHGVKKDYTGKENITPDVFLKVLQGKKSELKGICSERIIDSGPNDNVFVYFSGHGAPGIVAFGHKFLHVVDLMKALKNMHTTKRFAKLLFYMEACESGSMFENQLTPNMNVLGVTAANATESSYACYYDKMRQTYLGNVFSGNWMENSDQANLNVETIGGQYEIVRKRTKDSHVCQFGDMGINPMVVAKFQGTKISEQGVRRIPDPNVDAVRSEDVEFEIMGHLLASAPQTDKEKYSTQREEEEKKRKTVDSLIRKIVSIATNHNGEQIQRFLTTQTTLSEHEAYKVVVEHLADKCPELGLREQYGYALKQLHAFVHLCNEIDNPQQAICDAITKASQ